MAASVAVPKSGNYWHLLSPPPHSFDSCVHSSLAALFFTQSPGHLLLIVSFFRSPFSSRRHKHTNGKRGKQTSRRTLPPSPPSFALISASSTFYRPTRPGAPLGHCTRFPSLHRYSLIPQRKPSSSRHQSSDLHSLAEPATTETAPATAADPLIGRPISKCLTSNSASC